MSYTNGLDKPTDYFNTVLYSGNSSTNAITGVGHQPDLTWIKRRNGAEGHIWIDSVRGVDKRLGSNVTSAESTVTYFTSFDSDGFTVNGTNTATNVSGGTFCAWNWLAGGTASSNTDGSITSSVSANTTSGFSIATYTGAGSNATIGHGLGVAPNFIIVKRRDGAEAWAVGCDSIGWGNRLTLDTTAASAAASTTWNSTAPTSTVFSIGTNARVNNGDAIAYCFAEKKGYSKFGSYTGNGNADGTFIYTGFKPAWVMYKVTSAVNSWVMQDTKRSTTNVIDDYLLAEKSNAEATSSSLNIDFLSNGFKHRNSSNASNASGSTYIYMAFAENPFTTSTGIPTTAR